MPIVCSTQSVPKTVQGKIHAVSPHQSGPEQGNRAQVQCRRNRTLYAKVMRNMARGPFIGSCAILRATRQDPSWKCAVRSCLQNFVTDYLTVMLRTVHYRGPPPGPPPAATGGTLGCVSKCALSRKKSCTVSYKSTATTPTWDFFGNHDLDGSSRGIVVHLVSYTNDEHRSKEWTGCEKRVEYILSGAMLTVASIQFSILSIAGIFSYRRQWYISPTSILGVSYTCIYLLAWYKKYRLFRYILFQTILKEANIIYQHDTKVSFASKRTGW